jgi:predicted nucleic acid-binding protein
MTAPVFVDTNVFLYWRDRRDPTKQARAAEWLAHLWREQAGRTSIQVLSEYYVNVTAKLAPGLAPDEAWDDVLALFAWEPQPIDGPLLERGRAVSSRYGLSWWDSLVVAAAQAQGCTVLLTEDLQDGAVYGGVAARSPFTLAVGEDAPAYRVAAPRRRPYRRPRAESRPRRRVSPITP